MNVYLSGAPDRLYKKVFQNPRMRGDGGLAWRREARKLCIITVRPPPVARLVFGPAWFLHMFHVIRHGKPVVFKPKNKTKPVRCTRIPYQSRLCDSTPSDICGCCISAWWVGHCESVQKSRSASQPQLLLLWHEPNAFSFRRLSSQTKKTWVPFSPNTPKKSALEQSLLLLACSSSHPPTPLGQRCASLSNFVLK